ncbi:NAD(P)-binding protein [Hypoxylon sp. NC1633]|nr:NAD(P)-binding protein [Hypoxylon sp. NC1633]
MAQGISFDITPEKEASFLQFLGRHFSRSLLGGKTAIVTGASGGIGKECSRQLLDLGLSKLILAVRDEAKGEATRKTLTTEKTLEYASYDSVMTFGCRAEELIPCVDIAILNAGVNRGSFSLCQNQPGPFDERNEEPMLSAFDDSEAKYNEIDRYATTKLLGQFFVAELARRVPLALAIVNCANPGLCHSSGLPKELGLVTFIFTRVIGHSCDVGARTLVNAAVKQDESSHGQYVEDGQLRPMATLVYSKEAPHITKRLWKETVEELSFARVQDIIESLVQGRKWS